MIWNDILLWLHLSALALAGVAAFGIPAIGWQGRRDGADVAYAPMRRLASAGRGALVLLIVTGPLLAWSKFGGMSGLGHWFDAKMAFVVVLLAIMVVQGVTLRRAAAGDAGSARRLPLLDGLGIVALLAVVFCAVFAFNS